MKVLTKQEVIDIICGCTVLGAGGGGTLERGIAIVEEDFEAGREFILADISEVPDDEMVAAPYVCGSVSPLTPEEKAKYADLPSMEVTEAVRSFQVLEEYYGKEFYGVISIELGGENTADAFHVAALMGKPIIDADPAGRSVPELQHTTFYINDVPITPLAIATPFGDTAIINNVVNDLRAEELVRAMSVASRNTIGVTDHPVNGETLKRSVIHNAITYSLKVGKAVREANETGKDPAVAICEAVDGKVLFRGVVKEHTYDTVDGFTVGNTTLDGEGEYEGHEYKVWYKNEHILSYRDGEVDVTVPDLICIIDSKGVPVTNPFYEKGQRLTIFALPAPKEWTTERGLEVFGPKSFGFDIEYVPFNEK